MKKICSYYKSEKRKHRQIRCKCQILWGLSPKSRQKPLQNTWISFPPTRTENTHPFGIRFPATAIFPLIFILPGNGSSELISLLIQERAPKHTLILGPTYSEYSRELSFSGSTQEYYHLQESNDFEPDIPDLCRKLEQGYDFLILCNPNNPTSSAITQEELRRLIGFCAEKNIFVMIDETYVEFAPDINAITAVPLTREFTNLMVLRGVSKFFAAPGMRLGYGITGNMDFLAKMREKQTPWSLNSLGAFAGEIMLQDEDYIKETRNLILSERDRMIRELRDTDTYKIYPAYANFILLRILKNGLTSYDVFEACIRQGSERCSLFRKEYVSRGFIALFF